MKHILVFSFFINCVPSFAQYKKQISWFYWKQRPDYWPKGKAKPAVKFLLNSNGLNVQLRKKMVLWYLWSKKRLLPFSNKKTTYRIPEKKKKKEPEYNFEYVFHRVDIDLNSNSNVELLKNKNQKILIIIITFQTIPRNTRVHSFKSHTKNIYPNIDVFSPSHLTL
jgi:hypothetical protein